MSNYEELLAERIRKGDYNAFGDLFKLYYKPLIFCALRIIHKADTAEEIVQDTFCRLWEKHEEIIVTTNIRQYLFGAVHNNCLRFIRDESRHSQKLGEIGWVDSNSGNQLEERFEEEIYLILDRSLAMMPEKTRQIFKLNRDEGKKYREIAEILAISEKTVESHISAALKILRKNLSEFIR
jgi:RNA polymerase sigma-70 factor, ECF subfamily